MKKPKNLPFRSKALNRKVLDSLEAINKTKTGNSLPNKQLGLCLCLVDSMGSEKWGDICAAQNWLYKWTKHLNADFFLYLPSAGVMTRVRKITLNKLIKHMKECLA